MREGSTFLSSLPSELIGGVLVAELAKQSTEKAVYPPDYLTSVEKAFYPLDLT